MARGGPPRSANAQRVYARLRTTLIGYGATVLLFALATLGMITHAADNF